MEIRINAPGAGEWIMQRAGGAFIPGHAHSLSTHRDEEIQGGFVLDSFTGPCACVHMAGTAPGGALLICTGWCTITRLIRSG